MKYSSKTLLLCLAGFWSGFFPFKALAQSQTYPTNSRAIFLAGCMTDDPNLDFQNEDEVYSKMQLCVCLLDNFQLTYTNAEFINLFDRASRNEIAAKQELDRFASKHYFNCS